MNTGTMNNVKSNRPFSTLIDLHFDVNLGMECKQFPIHIQSSDIKLLKAPVSKSTLHSVPYSEVPSVLE